MASTLYLIGFLGEEISENFLETRHLTLMQDFSIPDKKLPGFLKDLERISLWFEPMNLEASETAYLGEFEDIPVRLVGGQDIESLRNFHKTLCELILKFDGHISFPEFSMDNFLPHLSYLENPISFVLESFQCVYHSEGFGRGIKTLSDILLEHN